MAESTPIGLIGTGIMGRGMGGNLLAAGHDLIVWNRTPSNAKTLVESGAILAESPAAVAERARVVITMVSDGEAVRAVVNGESGVFEGIGDDGIWIQMSTVGVSDTRAFAQLAKAREIGFADAPVLGTRAPAESGELIILASVSGDMREQVEPIFEAIGKRTIWVGNVGDATRLKLVINNWVIGLVGVLAETVALAEGLEVDPGMFFEAIGGGPLDSAYAHIKGAMMLKDDFEPSFPLRLALKDSQLIREAAHEVGLEPDVIRAVAERLSSAVEMGLGDEDMAAVVQSARSVD